jgi:hypothetical protein
MIPPDKRDVDILFIDGTGDTRSLWLSHYLPTTKKIAIWHDTDESSYEYPEVQGRYSLRSTSCWTDFWLRNDSQAFMEALERHYFDLKLPNPMEIKYVGSSDKE